MVNISNIGDYLAWAGHSSACSPFHLPALILLCQQSLAWPHVQNRYALTNRADTTHLSCENTVLLACSRLCFNLTSEWKSSTESLSRQGDEPELGAAAIRQDRWSAEAQKVPQGMGSGFFWDDKGHVVTNFHGTCCTVNTCTVCMLHTCTIDCP